MPVKLSVVIPIYNSQKIVEDSVRQVINVLGPLGIDYEVLLRDDGSPDKSKETIEDIANSEPKVRSFSNEGNKGLGYTLRELFKGASGEFIVYTDCDLPFGPEVIPELLKEIDGHDIVVASRYKGGTAKVLLVRKVTSRLYYALCRVLFNIKVLDIGSGTVILRSELLNNIKLTANGFDHHIEFFVRSVSAGAVIKEVPFPTRDIGVGSFNIIKHGFRIVFNTLKLWFDLKVRT